MYQGHMPDGSSVQRHSAGPLYPCVIYAQQRGDALAYGVISPENQVGELIGSYDQACTYAAVLNAARTRRAQFAAGGRAALERAGVRTALRAFGRGPKVHVALREAYGGGKIPTPAFDHEIVRVAREHFGERVVQIVDNGFGETLGGGPVAHVPSPRARCEAYWSSRREFDCWYDLLVQLGLTTQEEVNGLQRALCDDQRGVDMSDVDRARYLELRDLAVELGK